jgi:hypothetical protein
LPFVTSGALYLGLPKRYGAHQAIINQNIQRLVNKVLLARGKHVAFVIPQELHIIRRLQIGENQREIMVLHIILLSAIYGTRKLKERLWYSIKLKCEGPFTAQAL